MNDKARGNATNSVANYSREEMSSRHRARRPLGDLEVQRYCKHHLDIHVRDSRTGSKENEPQVALQTAPS